MINAKLHGILDYVLIIGFLLAPTVLDLGYYSGLLCYGLGVVHFILTIATKMPLGWLDLVPFRIHGFIELLVGLVLPVAAYMLYQVDGDASGWFFGAAAFIILLVWLLTPYKLEAEKMPKTR